MGVNGCYKGLPPVSAADGAWCVAGQMTTCENYCTVSGLCTVPLCASTSDTPVPASSASSWEPADPYNCHLPMNCYDGHGAVELDHEDINRGGSPIDCAEACEGDQRCVGFVYMGSQRKCWRRSHIWLSGCERGEWGQESSEFMTCLRQAPCAPQGQSCQNNGDCCDKNVCKQLLGGKGKVCAPPPCKPEGQSCQNNGDCCDKNVCQQLFGGEGKVCT